MKLFQVLQSGNTPVPISVLQEDELTYRAVLNDDGCAVAVMLMKRIAQEAHSTMLIVSGGLQPFSNATLAEQNSLSSDTTLEKEIRLANQQIKSLKNVRNNAWFAEAKCLFELNEQSEAVNKLVRLLEFIEPNEDYLWRQVRTLLWQQVGFEVK